MRKAALRTGVNDTGASMREETNEFHLDAVGGVAGDMFIAAVLDAFPDLAQGTLAAIRAAGGERAASAKLVAHRDAVLTGSPVRGGGAGPAQGCRPFDHSGERAGAHALRRYPCADRRRRAGRRREAARDRHLHAARAGRRPRARRADGRSRLSRGRQLGLHRRHRRRGAPHRGAGAGGVDGERLAAGIRAREDRPWLAARSRAGDDALARGFRARRRRHCRRARHAHGGGDPALSRRRADADRRIAAAWCAAAAVLALGPCRA